MHYRKLQADSIFNGYQLLEENVLIVAPDDSIEAIVPATEAGDEIESWEGILVPGFINCHCHLELSHLKGLMEPGTGLVSFLLQVIKARKNVGKPDPEAIAAAEEALYRQGVAGVADICNTTDSIAVKSQSKILWHNLVEVINLMDETTTEKIEYFSKVEQQFQELDMAAILTPHAPYTVSKAAFEAINAKTAGGIISIHNQETSAENELFQNGSGDFMRLYTQVAGGINPFVATHKSSLKTWLPHFTNGQTILLVHNTFITEEDLVLAKEQEQAHGLKLYFCLCPNANVYIENRIAPIDLLLRHSCNIVLGTDSYSSNWQLDMASELNTIRKVFPHIPLEKLLSWVTSNGATAMRWPHLGVFNKGKKPGVVLLSNTATSMESKRII